MQEPSPESLQRGGFTSENLMKTLLIYSVSSSNFRGLVVFWGLSPPKPPWRRDWLPTDVYFENCITKPCQLGRRSFGCSPVITTSYIRRYCDEQRYSMQPLPSCATISINALFKKALTTIISKHMVYPCVRFSG